MSRAYIEKADMHHGDKFCDGKTKLPFILKNNCDVKTYEIK